jgi:protoporphyrinogen oxidase
LFQKTAIIMGAGPAGLTAALELLNSTDIIPIVLERSSYMGGISRTINYKGNRMDIGGHRFFSKSDRVMEWWLKVLPLENGAAAKERIAYQGATRSLAPAVPGPDPEREDRVMLVRNRKSRIYFLSRFFDYPISLSSDTLNKLGFRRTVRIGLSYLRSAIMPIRNVRTLEQFFINRFGKELYLTFFKEYTEKVWGVPCSEISAEWGAQRIKGLSITKTISHQIRKRLWRSGGIAQKTTETSLIEKFLYPKYGPGQMWEEVARQVLLKGGKIMSGMEVTGLEMEGDRVNAVAAVDTSSGERKRFEGDYFFSTLPIKELVRSMDREPPPHVREISDGLLYRDFITVGLLLRKLKIADDGPGGAPIADNWIYIQEPNVLAGRLQVFNNWSSYMVADPGTVWIGVEYFCYETDDLWKLSDEEMTELAKRELARIGIIDQSDVLDSTVHRMAKTYPAYFGTYARFSELREYLDRIENLFLVGRNGMHKYNNQDHSMLTAMTAVENIAQGRIDKSNIWAVNTEMEYQETRVQKSGESARLFPETAKAAVTTRE